MVCPTLISESVTPGPYCFAANASADASASSAAARSGRDMVVMILLSLCARRLRRSEGLPFRLQADPGCQILPRKIARVRQHRTGRLAQQDLLRDRSEVGAEVHRALVHQNRLLCGLDADESIHLLVGHLRLFAC